MRGAVVIETALTVGIGLTILLFAVQVGALGFLQVTADAASYTAARAYAVGVLPSTSPAAFVHNTFPQIAATDITSPASPSPAPSAPLAVESRQGPVHPMDRRPSCWARSSGVFGRPRRSR